MMIKPTYTIFGIDLHRLTEIQKNTFYHDHVRFSHIGSVYVPPIYDYLLDFAMNQSQMHFDSFAIMVCTASKFQY